MTAQVSTTKIARLLSAAIGIAGLCTVATPAHASPAFPGCTQFGFNGPFVLQGYPKSTPDAQWQVSLNSTGTTPSGPATLVFSNGGTVNGRVVNGGVIDGRNVNFRIQWNDKPNNFWDFVGTVNDYGRANGDETLPGGAMPAEWHSDGLLDCLASKPQGAPAQDAPSAADICAKGFVWREARPTDHVCVPPPVRDQTAAQNSTAAQNQAPEAGAYGLDTCKQSFVWREAYDGDHVCVLPDVRTEAAADNAAAPQRLADATPAPGSRPIDPGTNVIPDSGN